MNSKKIRSAALEVYDLSASEIEELLSYNKNVFARDTLRSDRTLPLEPESHLAVWEQYAKDANESGAYAALKPHLVQLQFPISFNISQNEAYRGATRKGESVESISIATGLVLQEPEKLRLVIHQTIAGPIPVIIAAKREDFVTLLRALTKRNEPHPIPDSMGACIVGGYNNWHRIRIYKDNWLAQNPEKNSESEWKTEFKNLIPRKELYQDRFILLSSGFYSKVDPAQLRLTASEWEKLSLEIRLEHECTHYLTRRLFGSMRNNLIDELIADYRGIVSALGYYRADWFLEFLGLGAFPTYRQGGRLENYRGEPPLSDRAFQILQILVKKAAENLERFDRQYFSSNSRTPSQDFAILVALTSLTLEELALPSAVNILESLVSGCQKNYLKIRS